MQLIINYFDRLQNKDVLTHSLNKFKNREDTDLIILHSNAEMEHARDWAVSVRHNFNSVIFKETPHVTLIDEKELDLVVSKNHSLYAGIKIHDEIMVLHPRQVPCANQWDTGFRDTFRLADKLCVGVGVKDESSKTITKSFFCRQEFFNKVKPGAMFANITFFECIKIGMNKMSEVFESVPYLCDVHEYRERYMSEKPEVVEATVKESLTVEPPKKRAKKKSSKKAAKKASRKPQVISKPIKTEQEEQ